MTREEAIRQLKKCKSFHNGSYGEALTIAIKALEQGPILEKIKAEIEKYDNFILCANGQKGIHIDKALEIIDKYKAESEVK